MTAFLFGFYPASSFNITFRLLSIRAILFGISLFMYSASEAQTYFTCDEMKKCLTSDNGEIVSCKEFEHSSIFKVNKRQDKIIHLTEGSGGEVFSVVDAKVEEDAKKISYITVKNGKQFYLVMDLNRLRIMVAPRGEETVTFYWISNMEEG